MKEGELGKVIKDQIRHHLMGEFLSAYGILHTCSILILETMGGGYLHLLFIIIFF